MPQIFFIVEIPKPAPHFVSNPPSDVSPDWRAFEFELDGDKPPTSKKSRVSRNVWLLESEGALTSLLAIANLADTHSLQYQAFLVSGEVVAMSKPVSKMTTAPLNI